ncbi:cytidine deaminase [Alloprevotella sp. OH1205_COT-284]|uniref:cytidine deaminase n=1 Tax=Alloprevotella sp. OH1205_COT-284 TaxID=2491043 RepID=UPI000F5EF658|nr:cytidine deaminase [Alloprevotella sp. OH1205_COT-284]RRD76642.1 cytidine deaminase [Alloprevotella sp. OH1205_COT-284]
MKETTIQIPIKIYPENGTGLSEQLKNLVEQAKNATETSYAAYSGFHVGAALLLENGEVVCGSNQENAAYPAGICAERTAIFYANAHQPKVAPVAIAIAAWRKTDKKFLAHPISPCGICRQVLVETETRYKQKIKVLLYGDSGIYEVESASQLLPFRFDSDAL